MLPTPHHLIWMPNEMLLVCNTMRIKYVPPRTVRLGRPNLSTYEAIVNNSPLLRYKVVQDFKGVDSESGVGEGRT